MSDNRSRQRQGPISSRFLPRLINKSHEAETATHGCTMDLEPPVSHRYLHAP